MFEKVLIATDFSKHAKNVIECIGEMPGLKRYYFLMSFLEIRSPESGTRYRR